MAKYPEWEYELLRYLGTPSPLTNEGMDAQFPNSLLALNLWAQSEGSVTNNALATSGQGRGATTCVAQCGSSSPIYEYDNVADGVAQMGRFLQGSFYTKIVSALVTNADLGTIFNAVNTSPWCKGCQNGQYPTALAAAVGGKSPGVSGTVGVGSGGPGGATLGAGAASSTSCNGCPNGATDGCPLCKCVISIPHLTCVLTVGNIKWFSGAAALVGGAILGAFGVILLASSVFDASGAKQSVAKVASALPGPAGNIVRGGGAGATSTPRSSQRSAPAARPVFPQPPASEPQTAGRIESRQIERRYRETERQQGSIGPRGGSSTSTRVATRERRGTSMAGARRRPVRRGEGFGGRPGAPDGPQ